MNRESLFAVTVLAAALPALAAPNCNAPQVVSGNNCTLSVALGWAIAGLGTDSIVTIYVPPSASGPVDIEVTGLSSNLGSTYTGYFGFMSNSLGLSNTKVLTLSDLTTGAPHAIGSVAPGQLIQFQVTQVCWDPTCTTPAPAGAVPNMFSLQLSLSSPSTADINSNDVQLVGRFLNGGQVTFEVQVPASHANSSFSIVPGIDLGAMPTGRYVYNGTAVTQPYAVLSVSNLVNPNTIYGTAALQDSRGNTVATAPIRGIPPGGAAGYLVIGRYSGDPLALFPFDIAFSAGSDGIFHGSLVVSMNGLAAGGLNIVSAQEFNGDSVLNLFVFQSPVP
jgi:hypothetical protein